MTGHAAVELRPAGVGDDELTFATFVSSRGDEFAALPWTAEQLSAFLRQQYGFRSAHYAAVFPGAVTSVVEVGGEPVGSLIRWRSGDVVRLVDIAMLGEHRGRGVGTEALRLVLAEADAAACAVELSVEHTNPARRWYERHGFVETAVDELRAEMRREPRRAGTPVS